jgi:hypothetical protein
MTVSALVFISSAVNPSLLWRVTLISTHTIYSRHYACELHAQRKAPYSDLLFVLLCATNPQCVLYKQDPSDPSLADVQESRYHWDYRL